MFGVNYENPWVKDVQSTPRRLTAWMCVFVATTVAVVVLFAARHLAPRVEAWIAGALHALPSSWPAILARGMAQFLVFGLFLAVATAATRIDGRTPWRLGPRSNTALITGLALGGGGVTASVGIAWLAGAVTGGPPAPVSAPMGGLIVGALLIAFQCVSEEAYFRGWLQPSLCARWGPWIGLAATSVLFAGLHLIGRGHGILAVLNLFLGGLVFGLLALRSGGLMASAAAHFAWNWTEAGGLGLVAAPGGSVISLSLRNGTPLADGADGMNGSLSTTLVLAGLVVALVLIGVSRSGPPAGRRSDHAP